MPVLVLLILLDIAVMGLIMYAVMREKPKHITTTHPFVIEAQKNEEKARTWQIETVSDAEAAEKTEKVEEKADQ
jgi:hypothetical protein